MNYYKYIPIDVVNGPGTRCTLFVCGCEHHCKGCYNQATWPFDAGFPFGEDQEDRIISDLNDTRIHRRGSRFLAESRFIRGMCPRFCIL